MHIVVILFLCVALPIAWLASEFQPRRWIRIALGLCAIGMFYAVAFAVGTFEHWNVNSCYGFASKELIDTTVLELEAGNAEKVIQ